MIPQIVDTVVFIDEGDIGEIYEVSSTVKTPTGLADEGLARPVVEVREHESGTLAFEIYTFGDQVVVMPIGGIDATKPMWKLAQRTLEHELRREVRGHLEVRVESDGRAIIYVRESDIGGLVGRGGQNVRALEDEYGISFDIRSLVELGRGDGEEVEVHVDDDVVALVVGPSLRGQTVEVAVDGETVFSGAVSRRGDVSLSRGSRPAEQLAKAHQRRRKITAKRI